MKKQKNQPPDAEIPVETLVAMTIREAVELIRSKIAEGDVAAAYVTSLINLDRSLRKHPDDSPADLDRRVRELEPAERQSLMREWAKLDGQKGSGLA